MRWSATRAWLPALVAMVTASMAGPVRAADAPRPNVLLILADDLGFSDLGCYGGEIKTPNLDALAKDGIRMTRMYSTGRCCPSRASLLTGQYPHRVGLGHMVKDLGQPGYRGTLSPDARTIAQVLKPAGYRSFISGKWHLGTDDPTKSGFEEFFGTINSASTFWDSRKYVRRPDGREERRYVEGEFYGTDALTDSALDFLGLARKTPDKPWFLYLAYNAPHFPIQAKPQDIARYAAVYEAGWDNIRQKRLERMKELGIVPEPTTLTPRSAYTDWFEKTHEENPAWDSLPADRRADLARRMAIYAAMVDCMDQNIGRVVASLRQAGELDNTLIVFLSDNGGCAEWDPKGFDGKSGPENVLHRDDQLAQMGGPDTYHSVGSAWANTSNTPWRLYKHYAHEGGISGPCIVHWPKGVRTAGSINQQPAHLIDLLPTVMAAAGAPDAGPLPPAGVSLMPVFAGDAAKAAALVDRKLYFEHEGHRAVHAGQWKLVAERDGDWELYDISVDRSELNNLAAKHPNRVKELAEAWTKWAESQQVLPFPKDYQVGYMKARE